MHCICQTVLIVISHSLLVRFWHLLLPYFSFGRGTIPVFFQFPDTDIILTHTLNKFHSFFINNCYISLLTPFTSAALLFSNILTTFDSCSSSLHIDIYTFIQFARCFIFLFRVVYPIPKQVLFPPKSFYILPPSLLPTSLPPFPFPSPSYTFFNYTVCSYFSFWHILCAQNIIDWYITFLFCSHNYNQF